MKKLDLLNQRFGKLEVIGQARNSESKRIMWKCRCDCGNIIFALSFHLKNGRTKSCGCLAKQRLKTLAVKHNMSHTRIYRIWKTLRKRCNNPNDTNYKYYGKRGISVCKDWDNDFMSFYNWAMQNGYEDNLTIDRIDNNGNYEPGNCRWVDMKTQNSNNRNNHKITYNNKTLTLTQWSIIYDIPYQTLATRLHRGWTIEKALTTPIKKR